LRISQDLLVAALGSNPAIKALKIKYDMAQHDIVLQVKRIRQQVIKPCVLKVENATFALEFDESNYNCTQFGSVLAEDKCSRDTI